MGKIGHRRKGKFVHTGEFNRQRKQRLAEKYKKEKKQAKKELKKVDKNVKK